MSTTTQAETNPLPSQPEDELTQVASANAGRKILRSFSILLSGQIVTWSFTAVYTIIAPRYLGPDNMGRQSLAYAITYIMTIFVELGMVNLMIREVAKDHDLAGTLINAMLIWRLITTSIAYAGLLLALHILNYPVEYRPFFYFVGLTMIIDLLAEGFSSLFRALENFKYSTAMDISSKIVTLILAAIVVVFNLPPWCIAAALTCASLTALIQGWWWSRNYVKLSWKVSFKTLRWLVWNSLPLWGSSMLLVIYTYIDSLLLSILTNDAAVGFYSAPVRLFNTSIFLPSALSMAVFPSLSRLYASDRPAMVELSARSLRWLVAGSLPIAVMVMVLSPNFIILLYGESYRPSIPVMAVLGLTLFSTYISVLANQFLVAAHRQLEWTKVMAAATLLNPIINLFLINFFQKNFNDGAVGAAWSLFITETLMLIPAFLLLPPGIFNRQLVAQSARIGLACLPMAAVAWWLGGYFIIIPAAAGGLVFLAVAWLIGAFPKEEVALARQMLRRSA